MNGGEGEGMQSIITSKFQTTIPKAVRENLKLSIQDALEWKIERGKVVVSPVQKKFLQYRNALRTGRGDISADIERARDLRAEKHR
jgi:bifunctional DNA-binding transcriptional regulator/antitoxin component of YhaV-PrlF toxin-antitoxin module